MELTREEAVRLFREHWKWLAETGGDFYDKRHWIKENGYRDVISDCFLCEYTQMQCGICPIVWEDMKIFFDYEIYCARSYYGLWDKAATKEERKRLAKIISELPEKEVTP